MQQHLDGMQSPKVVPDSLPIDIWRNIFEFACTDGGRISMALSRVSRAFRSISAAYRFHSVRLSKLRDIQAFLTQYEAALAATSVTGDDPPRVRHLLLSFLPGETDVILLEGAYHMRDFHAWRDDKSEWNARCVDLLTRLFALACSHLETLTVLQSRRIPLPFVRCALPALHELTLLADDRLFVRLPVEVNSQNAWIEESNSEWYASGGPLDLTAVAADPPFPALARLQIVDVRDGDQAPKLLPWATTLPVWGKLAPRLAVLRLSHVGQATLCDVRNLVRAMPPPFPVLRTLVLQPSVDNVEVMGDIREACKRGPPKDGPPEGRVDCVYVCPATGGDDEAFWASSLAEEWSARM